MKKTSVYQMGVYYDGRLFRMAIFPLFQRPGRCDPLAQDHIPRLLFYADIYLAVLFHPEVTGHAFDDPVVVRRFFSAGLENTFHAAAELRSRSLR